MRNHYLTLSLTITGTISTIQCLTCVHGHRVCTVKSIKVVYSHGRVFQPRFSRLSPFESSSFEIGQGYRRRDARTRREDSRVSPPGYASSFRPQRTRRWRRRAFGTTGPPTLSVPLGQFHRRPFIRRPCLSTHVSSMIPAGAPSPHSSAPPRSFLFSFFAPNMHLRTRILAIL